MILFWRSSSSLRLLFIFCVFYNLTILPYIYSPVFSSSACRTRMAMNSSYFHHHTNTCSNVILLQAKLVSANLYGELTPRDEIHGMYGKISASAPLHGRQQRRRRHTDWNRQCICGLNPIFFFFLSYTIPYTPTKFMNWIILRYVVPLRQKKICKYFSIGFGTSSHIYKKIYILGIGNAYINIVSSSPTIYTGGYGTNIYSDDK